MTYIGRTEVYYCFLKGGPGDTLFGGTIEYLIGTFIRKHASLSLHAILHMNDWMTDWELKIFANVRVQAHDVYIFDCFILTHFIVQTHGLCSTTI
jgi:hypothetical protein